MASDIEYPGLQVRSTVKELQVRALVLQAVQSFPAAFTNFPSGQEHPAVAPVHSRHPPGHYVSQFVEAPVVGAEL